MTHEYFMRKAIKLSEMNVENGGGPFGAVIVKDGVIVGEGVNSVSVQNDPTAHAEIVAIRKSAQKLGTYNLCDCVIYTSCEPCPMCIGAIYWAHISGIYYGNTKDDAEAVGFDDKFIYKEIELPLDKRSVPTARLLQDEANIAFRMWDEKPDKIRY